MKRKQDFQVMFNNIRRVEDSIFEKIKRIFSTLLDIYMQIKRKLTKKIVIITQTYKITTHLKLSVLKYPF